MTYAILFNDNDFKVSATPREIYEAINHKYAISHILNHLDEELSERLIKDVAVLINKNISEIAGYRTVSVRIKGAQHVPPAPNQIPQQMMYFVYHYNHTEYEDIFQKLAETHIHYERIHPFEDGNGRTGRLILNFELIRNNMPPIVIPKDDRTKYFGMLAEQNSQELAGFFKELCQEEQKRIEALAGCGKEYKRKTGFSLLNELFSQNGIEKPQRSQLRGFSLCHNGHSHDFTYLYYSICR